MKRVFIPVIALLIGAGGCTTEQEDQLEVSGLLEGIVVEAGSLTGGRVAEVLVEEGDAVKTGDVMVRLESDEAEALVAAAQAQLDQAEATLAKLEAGARPEQIRQAEAAAAQAEEMYQMALKGSRSQEIDAARAAAEAAKAQRDETLAEYKRAEKLNKQGVLSQQLFDRAKHAHEAAEAQLKGARERLEMVVQGARSEEIEIAKAAFDQAAAALDEIRNGAREEDVAAARALRDAAAANLRLARSKADEMAVPAPRDGVVESIDIYPGDLVRPGAIVRVIDPNELKMYIYVSPETMGKIRLGDRIAVTTDSFGEEIFEGTVTHIKNEGEFTPRNLQTQEARARQMFGIKLTLDSAGGRLKAGMTATAHVDLRGAGRATAQATATQ